MRYGYKLVLTALISFILSLLLLHSVFAQSASSTSEFSPSFAVTGSYSHNSFRAWGTMENTRQSFINLQINHSEIAYRSFQVVLSSEIIVAGRIYYPIDGLNGPRESSFGLGLIPLRLNIPLMNRGHTPFLTAASGIFVVDKPFPDSRGTKMNYILEAGFGYRFPVGKNRFMEIGYKLHHLSNGNKGRENPGIDSHMFFGGIVLPF